MRDIKFRAWLPDESRMINPVVVLKFSPQNETIAWYEDMTDAMDGKLTDTFMDKAIIMQFTGLKDVNGKEIYEKDRFRSHNSAGKSVGTVEYIEDGFKIVWDEPNYGCLNNILRIHAADGEVIGNVFESDQ